MFHLQSLELLHWDYCRRVQLPLDASIITIAGPNGSGKTTLLDAVRSLLGLECSGGRNYKTYARHAGAQQVWLRAVVDNRPRGRQSSSRPFASSLLHGDQVTLACRIERTSGDWQRRYLMVDSDRSIENLLEQPEKELQWLGVEAWRRRLAAAGLTPAIARVLSLEQGQTDRLCEFSPKELLKLVFDVFGDQEVLDRYEQARVHQQQLTREVEQAERELGHARTHLAELALRVTNWRQRQLKLRERERLATEVVPVLDWTEQREKLVERGRELHRQRLYAESGARTRSDQRRQLLVLHEQKVASALRLYQLQIDVSAALEAQQSAREAEKPVEDLVKRERELQSLAAVESDSAQLGKRLQSLQSKKLELDQDLTDRRREREQRQTELEALQGQRIPPAPSDVQRFRQVLRGAGIDHHVLADVVEIRDERWRSAVEGMLRGMRWMVTLGDRGTEAAAFALAERERYRHYVTADGERPVSPPKESLLAVVEFTAPVPGWLLKQLGALRRVESVEAGRACGGEWITPQAYHRDARGGRSVWLDPAQHQFGAAALAARRDHLERKIAAIDRVLIDLAGNRQAVGRQVEDAQATLRGHHAGEELASRSAEFAEARRLLPELTRARAAAGARWQALDGDRGTAERVDENAQQTYTSEQERLANAEQEAERQSVDWQERRREHVNGAQQSDERRAQFPLRWRIPDALLLLRADFTNAQQARLRGKSLDDELAGGQWETDETVEDRHHRMRAGVAEQEQALGDRSAHNEQARVAAHNARERYIDVLRGTVRLYRRNIQELGETAGVGVNAELPHLENDDVVLAQAGLVVKFNFDGKDAVGLNDGEASGGQQVMKSLILLVGLLKDDETPGGFVFIDEPFAHLDVRNIQLVGHFLRSTRAQYLLTTPITHNVEVFEPAEITLITNKKLRGERWAPPIAVVQRRGVPGAV